MLKQQIQHKQIETLVSVWPTLLFFSTQVTLTATGRQGLVTNLFYPSTDNSKIKNHKPLCSSQGQDTNVWNDKSFQLSQNYMITSVISDVQKCITKMFSRRLTQEVLIV